jgi:hypothetical protein
MDFAGSSSYHFFDSLLTGEAMSRCSHEAPRFAPAKSLCLAIAAVALVAPFATSQVPIATPTVDVTFTKDIAQILQTHCDQCHRPNGGGPMSLLTYEDARPWARAINQRTHLGPHAGVMPPWYVERDIGIQKFKNDPSLSDEELAKIAKWATSGALRGNPADMPPPVKFADADAWVIGTPDLIVKSKEIDVSGVGADWFGSFPDMPTGMTEDRYVEAVQVREVNDVPSDTETKTVGGRWVIHHINYSSFIPGVSDVSESPTGKIFTASGHGETNFPTHEVGRNADFFPTESGRLLAANSYLRTGSVHIHSNGRNTKAHAEFGFKFFPRGYQPVYPVARVGLASGLNIDAQPNSKQELHAYATLKQNIKVIAFEPHLHATGVRMCLEAIWGSDIQQLSCVGYDHNWVRQYEYADDAAPLLPKGTVLHLIGFIDTTSANRNVADTRNWAGSGRRSIANMFMDLGYSVALTDEQFQAEMAKRRKVLKGRNDYDIGCPLCWAPPLVDPKIAADLQGPR